MGGLGQRSENGLFPALAVAQTAAWVLAALVAAGAGPEAAATSRVPEVVAVPAGPYIRGSDRLEREAAYLLDEVAYGHNRTRTGRWYENEPVRQTAELPFFEISRHLVTNAQYAAFASATGHRVPDVDPATWRGYSLIHPYQRTRRHAWAGGAYPPGRGDHPVVLVSHGDARAYAAWLSEATGRRWRLPSEAEWEKAARGPDGRRFPWGQVWDPAKLNSHDRGPFDTTPVGAYPAGVSPYGLLDAAGQVFEWTATPMVGATGAGGGDRFVVKGGSWDDSGCGVCRPAAGHGRPAALKHILIGFRLVSQTN